jgi:hypothetical protein
VLWFGALFPRIAMISTVETRKGTEAVTSDRWHVVHARHDGSQAKLPFVRSISSEHEDRAACVKAARKLVADVRSETPDVPLSERDQVFVRRPGFKTIKNATRRPARTRPSPNAGDA